MSQNRYQEAIEQYTATLERATERRLALEGIEKATQLSKNEKVEI
jgi:hypothetical protein